MRIIFLNSWYAKTGKTFYNFILDQSSKTDIFALSEVYPEMFSKLESLLPDFRGHYVKSLYDRTLGFIYGQAVFVKRKMLAKDLSRIEIFRNVYNDMGYAVPFEIIYNGNKFYVINVHGKARPGHKLDTPARIRQSKRIISRANEFDGPVIIGGDFNLLPDTLSIRLFEKAGLKSLIKEFGIKETRGKLNHQNYEGQEIQHFADFCFVSSDIKVKNFEVPKVEISDHLPLILDFEI